MIELRVKKADIVLAKQLFESLNINAIISDGRIIFNKSELEKDNFLERLCSYVTILEMKNYCKDIKFQNFILNSNIIESYDLIYAEVKRGQVYWCDYGIPYKGEVAYMRPVIVVQNDAIASDTAIVVPCTTTFRSEKSWRLKFEFSQQNMVDFWLQNDKESYLMTDKIVHVDKTRLRQYIGTMTEAFMSKVDEYILKTLAIKNKIVYKQTSKVVYLRSEKKSTNVKEKIKVASNLNLKQIQLLAGVDINELIKASKSHASNEVKADKILKIFGFDMEKKGSQFLLRAILFSIETENYNLEKLCEKIHKEGVGESKEEIKRLIVARIKEQLKFNKSPANDFIHLVNALITQGGMTQ